MRLRGSPRPGQCRPPRPGAIPGPASRPRAGPFISPCHWPAGSAGRRARAKQLGTARWTRTTHGLWPPGSPLTPRPPGALRSSTQAGGRSPTVAPGSYQALRKPGRPAARRRRRSPGSGRLAAPDHYHAAADQRMHSSPGRQRLPARTQAAAPHPGPQRVLYRARVPSAGERCDLDHTIPHHLGGRTCECNLGPVCRRHHRCKQAPGWDLSQPRPGVMRWTTPAGRTYTTAPTVYGG